MVSGRLSSVCGPEDRMAAEKSSGKHTRTLVKDSFVNQDSHGESKERFRPILLLSAGV